MEHVSSDVNVLDPTVSQVDLATEQYAPGHRNTLVVETVAQSMVLAEKHEHRERKTEERQDRDEEIVGHQHRVRSGDGVWVKRRSRLHVGHQSISMGSGRAAADPVAPATQRGDAIEPR
jgi:hypothetical protein